MHGQEFYNSPNKNYKQHPINCMLLNFTSMKIDYNLST
jgi:hypothetical protein